MSAARVWFTKQFSHMLAAPHISDKTAGGTWFAKGEIQLERAVDQRKRRCNAIHTLLCVAAEHPEVSHARSVTSASVS